MLPADPFSSSSTAGGESSPTSIPDHELIRRVGKGAYGEVWLARNIMGVFRAIKIIRRGDFDSASPFQRELAGIKRFEPISRTHEGFVDVLQIGLNESEGYFYYIMEAADDLVHGQNIDPETYVPKTLGKALAREGRFSVEQCVQTGMALCQALDHLHSHGLVHRDIKPSNIIFINGSPKLADIGLVTDSEHAQSFVGTEGFIPPEGPGSPQADIYSLGKALYEIASGRDRLDFPAFPTDLEQVPERGAFLELNEALIRACRQRLDDRYPTAREMYEDLALLASQKSLRKLRILERRWKSLRRNTAIAAGILLLLALIGFPLIRERQHAEEIRERNIGVHSANGINKMDQGDYLGALGEFGEVFALEERRPHHRTVNQTRVASILASAPTLLDMKFLEPRVVSLQFSRDGGLLLAQEKSKNLRLFDQKTGQVILRKTNIPGLSFARFGPHDRSLIACSDEGYALILSLQGATQLRLDHPSNVLSAVSSHNGRWVATGCKDGNTRVWDAQSGKLLFDLPGHENSVRCLAFSNNDRLLATGGMDRTARIWDLSFESGPTSILLRHADWVVDLAFTSDDARLLTGCHDGWARLWDAHSGEEFHTLIRHDVQISATGFSPDGSLIYTASMDGTLRLWDANTTRPIQQNNVLRHSSDLFSATFSPDGRKLATGCADGTVRIWNLDYKGFDPRIHRGVVNDSASYAAILQEKTVIVKSLTSDQTNANSVFIPGTVRELALSSSGKVLGGYWTNKGSPIGTIAFWNISDPRQPLAKFEIVSNLVSKLTLSPDGAFAHFQESGKQMRIVDLKTASDWPVPGSILHKATVAFDRGSSRIAVGSGKQLGIFEKMKADPMFPIFELEGDIKDLDFSPTGDLLLVSQGDDSVKAKPAVLISLKDQQPKVTRFWHKDGQSESAFHPRTSRFATAGENRTALIWDYKTMRQLTDPLAHRSQVISIAYSHNGEFIGTVGGNRSVQIWDSETGHPITPPILIGRRISRILFTPDPRRFVTVDDPLRFSLWQLPQIDISPELAVTLGNLLNSNIRTRADEGATGYLKAWTVLRDGIASPVQPAENHKN